MSEKTVTNLKDYFQELRNYLDGHPERWKTGGFGFGSDCKCLLGWIIDPPFSRSHDLEVDADLFMRKILFAWGTNPIVLWNDYPRRKFEDILSILDKAVLACSDQT